MLAEALQAEVDAYIARCWRWRSSSSKPPKTDRWRAVTAPHLVALLRAGATFKGGKLSRRS